MIKQCKISKKKNTFFLQQCTKSVQVYNSNTTKYTSVQKVKVGTILSLFAQSFNRLKFIHYMLYRSTQLTQFCSCLVTATIYSIHGLYQNYITHFNIKPGKWLKHVSHQVIIKSFFHYFQFSILDMVKKTLIVTKG